MKIINHTYKYTVTLLILFSSVTCAFAQNVKYQWQSLPVVGGGFVPGIVCHPNIEGLRYCRTDMGGAYRWDNIAKRWVQLLDWLPESDSNLQGVESIALDPQHPERVYLACGTYTRLQGSILCSDDYGKTFQRINVPFHMGANENGRGNGERMMVDPKNSDVIYLGTRKDGLWRSTNRGKDWNKVTSFPTFVEGLDGNDRANWWRHMGSGIITVVFVPDAKLDKGKSNTQTIYVAYSLPEGKGLYVSKDGGETWKAVAKQPTLRPTHMVLANDGWLYISYADTPGPSEMTDGAVWKYNTHNEKWQDITPLRLGENGKAGFGYAAICVDPHNARHILTTTHYLHGQGGNNTEELFRSTDSGKTWTAIYKHGYEDDNSLAPYTKTAPLHWMFDIEIDPFNPDHVIFTTGFGGWETFNLSAADHEGEKVKWRIMSTGIEETVPLELYCPPSGAHLLTGIGDYGGFTYYDVNNKKPIDANHKPYFGNTDGVCGAWHKPEIMLRCGYIFNHLTNDAPISYSLDGGHNWQACANVPGDIKPGEKGEPVHGHVSMSANGTTWVWTPERKPAYYTTDMGKTWTECHGIPENIKIIADKENDKLFYAVDVRNQNLYISTDGARTFNSYQLELNIKQSVPDNYPNNRRDGRPEARPNGSGEGNHDGPPMGPPAGPPKERPGMNRGDSRGGQDRVYSIPGYSGQLWLAAYDGLYFIDTSAMLDSNNIIKPEQKPHVNQITAFGIGKAPDNCTFPTLYIIGTVDGQYGIFRSTDCAQSWIRINDDAHQFGKLLHIAGDMQDFGRIYIGTHGRGTIMGTIEN